MSLSSNSILSIRYIQRICDLPESSGGRDVFWCLVASRKQQLVGADLQMTPQCLSSMNQAIASRRHRHRHALPAHDEQPVASGALVIEINGTPMKPEEQSSAAAAPVHASFVHSAPAEFVPSAPAEESCLCKMTPGHIVALQAGQSQFVQIDAANALVVSDLNTDDEHNVKSAAFSVCVTSLDERGGHNFLVVGVFLSLISQVCVCV